MNVHAKLPESDELPTDLRARVAIKVGDNISTDEILPTGARGCGLRKTPGTQAPGVLHARGQALLTDRPQAIWNQLPGRGDVVRCGAGPLGGRAGDAL